MQGRLSCWEEANIPAVHKISVLGAFITEFGSTEGRNLPEVSKRMNAVVCPDQEPPWALSYLQATVRAWWLAEYSGIASQEHDSPTPDSDAGKLALMGDCRVIEC
jgi:hypothetical protein